MKSTKNNLFRFRVVLVVALVFGFLYKLPTLHGFDIFLWSFAFVFNLWVFYCYLMDKNLPGFLYQGEWNGGGNEAGRFLTVFVIFLVWMLAAVFDF